VIMMLRNILMVVKATAVRMEAVMRSIKVR
jgi:hypothetical protein